MKRCINALMTCLMVVGIASSLLPLTARSQTDSNGNVIPNVRKFPANAQRGSIMVTAPPEISVNGQADRMSPGVRVRDINNYLVLTGTIANQTLLVNYTRDNLGLVSQIWVLNTEEARQKMPGENGGGIMDTIKSLFDPAPAAVDDGNTPYDKLPSYKQ